ncbi:hypothetical protein IAT38_002988 [Cryptococcus sp. DSM 104549]
MPDAGGDDGLEKALRDLRLGGKPHKKKEKRAADETQTAGTYAIQVNKKQRTGTAGPPTPETTNTNQHKLVLAPKKRKKKGKKAQQPKPGPSPRSQTVAKKPSPQQPPRQHPSQQVTRPQAALSASVNVRFVPDSPLRFHGSFPCTSADHVAVVSRELVVFWILPSVVERFIERYDALLTIEDRAASETTLIQGACEYSVDGLHLIFEAAVDNASTTPRTPEGPTRLRKIFNAHSVVRALPGALELAVELRTPQLQHHLTRLADEFPHETHLSYALAAVSCDEQRAIKYSAAIVADRLFHLSPVITEIIMRFAPSYHDRLARLVAEAECASRALMRGWCVHPWPDSRKFHSACVASQCEAFKYYRGNFMELRRAAANVALAGMWRWNCQEARKTEVSRAIGGAATCKQCRAKLVVIFEETLESWVPSPRDIGEIRT